MLGEHFLFFLERAAANLGNYDATSLLETRWAAGKSFLLRSVLVALGKTLVLWIVGWLRIIGLNLFLR